MSVTFYDRDNPSEWNHEEGTIIAGGPEANFSNVNAGWILQVLGYPVNDSSDLIGEVTAQELDNRINKAYAAINNICTDPHTQAYMKRAFKKLMEVIDFSKSQFGCGIICWN